MLCPVSPAATSPSGKVVLAAGSLVQVWPGWFCLSRCGLLWAGLFGTTDQSGRAHPRGAVGKDAQGEALGGGSTDAARRARALPASPCAVLSSRRVPAAR